MSSPTLKANVAPALEPLLADFRDTATQRIDAWLAEREQRALAESNQDVLELTSRLREFVGRGGKRLRPALVSFGYRATGGEDEEAILPLALSTELLQAYLLMHDDIMDDAEVRRGKPTAHRAFEQDHRDRGWPGDAARHGESVAILLGDLAHAYAVELFLEGSRPFAVPELGRTFAAMCQEVVLGQYLEMTAPFRGALDRDALLQILRLKSGRYSVERPLELGVLAAGASPENRQGLARYGRVLGEAFQLRDDLLGVFGSSETVGKSVDSDIAEGKHTVLIQQTLERTAGPERQVVLEALGDPEVTAETLDRVRAVVASSGAKLAVEMMVAERLDIAREALVALTLEAQGRAFLEALVDFLGDRDY